MKNDILREQAVKLASRPYSRRVFRAELSDETGYAWAALNPELPGCISQGETVAEAISNLDDARVEYILSLLRRGFDVPLPIHQTSATTTATNHIWIQVVNVTAQPADEIEFSYPEVQVPIAETWVTSVSLDDRISA